MNVLVLLLVVGGSLALGMASLDNNIMTNAQDLGVGEKTIESEIGANLLLQIDRTTNPLLETDYKDLIVSCKFTLQNDEDPIPMGSIIYCKLLDEQGSVIAEGQLTLTETLDPGEMIEIPIDDIFAFDYANNIENVFDIVFVVQFPI